MNIPKLPATTTLSQLLLSMLVLLVLLFSACEKETIPETEIGQWRLIAILNDPGDGSGEWEDLPKEEGIQENEIEFKEDASFISSKSLCSIVGILPIMPGTYSSNKKTITTADGCEFSYSFEDSHLIIDLSCDEPCLEKYERIKVL